MAFGNKIKSVVVNALKKRGLALSNIKRPDIPENDWKLFKSIEKLTMTAPDRVFALIEALKYILEADIPGSLVECGVWKGGNAVVMLEMLKRRGDLSLREIWLYDTYEGMVEPTENDSSFTGKNASEIYETKKHENGGSSWCEASFDFVEREMLSRSFPKEKLKMVKGKVEDTLTIEGNIPEQISLLRLDTDWYESTKMELEVLFPKLVKGGVLIIDDYGDWKGSRKAVDEYFERHKTKMCLVRLSSGARLGIKQ